MADQSQPQGAPDAGPLHAFASIFQASPQLQHMMLFVPRMQAAMMRAAVTQQKETAAFLTRRRDEELKLADQIGKAETVKDVFTAWSGYWREAASQYAQEAGQVMERNSRSAREAADELGSEVTSAVQASLLRQAA